MQKLNVELSIEIPANFVLIKRIDYEELKRSELQGTYWTMKDLEQRTGKKQAWLKENILYPEKFRKVLDVEKGGFVFYPQVTGQHWSFQATKMAEFLDQNFHRIFKVTK